MRQLGQNPSLKTVSCLLTVVRKRENLTVIRLRQPAAGGLAKANFALIPHSVSERSGDPACGAAGSFIKGCVDRS